jgi:hypothetical protein
MSCSGEPDAEAKPLIPEVHERTGYLPSSLRESSGVAASRRQEGVLWSHNDSNNENRIYAINLQGVELATFRVKDAENRDWEDIAIGPCPRRNGDCLYIADTGDNLHRRETVSIYVIPEPEIAFSERGLLRDTEYIQKIDLRYEDGPQDVEAMAVGPRGEILLVTKGRRGPIHTYVISRLQLLAGPETIARSRIDPGIQRLRMLGRWVTGAAISPSGKRAVLRTYTELFFYTYDESGSLVPHGDPCFIGASEPQGEGVDFLDENTVILTSETLLGRPGPITLVRCPT